ncbi:MAG: c-type cytochrome [Ghiorsea sp.]|nr:c-type cytochrome [Ghiorsea sp.]
MNKAFYIMATVTVMLSLFSLVPNATAEEAANAPILTDAKPFQPSAQRGKIMFNSICIHCHHTTSEKSRVGAPGLQSVLERHDVTWLKQWLKSPETFAKTNQAASDLISSNKFGLTMPTLPITQNANNRADIIEYLKTL